MKHSEVLSRYVNTGTRIPKKQFDRLSKSLQKSYLRMRGVAGYEEWEFKVLSDDDRIRFIEKKGKTLNDDSSEIIEILLQRSYNKDLIVTKIIDTIGEQLHDDDIEILLEYSVNKGDIVTKIIKFGKQTPKKVYIELSPSLQKYYKMIRSIHGYKDWEFGILTDDEKINYVEKKGESLSNNLIFTLLKDSKSKEFIVKKIIEKLGNKSLSGIIDDIHGIDFILGYSENQDDIVTKIIEKKGKNLIHNDMNYLIKNLEDKDDFAKKIINIKGKDLENKEVYSLLRYSKDKELIKKLLLQNGVDYRKINLEITNLSLDIPIIPDNYQSMLQEIRRIKEIMI